MLDHERGLPSNKTNKYPIAFLRSTHQSQPKVLPCSHADHAWHDRCSFANASGCRDQGLESHRWEVLLESSFWKELHDRIEDKEAFVVMRFAGYKLLEDAKQFLHIHQFCGYLFGGTGQT